MDEIQQIQTKYIEEMEVLQRELMPWWLELNNTDDPTTPVADDVQTRWPFGLAGHPRIIATFRKFFLQLEAHNDIQLAKARDRLSTEEGPSITEWVSEEEEPTIGLARPIDILISDIIEKDLDIAKLVSGLVYIPVGLNQHNESV